MTSGERVAAARSVLDHALERVRGHFLTAGVEHLPYLAPIGIWFDGEIVEDSDGEAELFIVGRPFLSGDASDLTLADSLSRGTQSTDIDQMVLSVRLGAVRRNFGPHDLERLRATAPVPFHEIELRADLPPIIFVLSIGGVWAGGKFTGSLLQRLGEETASSLAEWIRSAHRAAKAAERDGLVSVEFETRAGQRVTAILPFNAAVGGETDNLQDGLERLGAVAVVAGSVEEGKQPAELREATFIYDDGQWRLGWWRSDEAVFETPWYRKHAPNPARFLGRPLFQLDAPDTDPGS